jgi:hypothetical protein
MIEQLRIEQIKLNERWMQEFNGPSAIEPYWQFKLLDLMRSRKVRSLFFTDQVRECFGPEACKLIEQIMSLQDKIVRMECGEDVTE